MTTPAYAGDDALLDLLARTRSEESLPRLRARFDRIIGRDAAADARTSIEPILKALPEGLAPRVVAELADQLAAFFELRRAEIAPDGAAGASAPPAAAVAVAPGAAAASAVASDVEEADAPPGLERISVEEAERLLVDTYRVPRSLSRAVDGLTFHPPMLPADELERVVKGDGAAVEPLAALLTGELAFDKPRAALHWVAVALGEIGDARAVPALVGAIVHKHATLNLLMAASEALARIGAAARPALHKALDENPRAPERFFYYAALAWIGDKADRGRLGGAVLGDPDGLPAIACAIAEYREADAFAVVYDYYRRVPVWARPVVAEVLVQLKSDPDAKRLHEYRSVTRYRQSLRNYGLFKRSWPCNLYLNYKNWGPDLPEPPPADPLELARIERLDRRDDVYRVYDTWLRTEDAAGGAAAAAGALRQLSLEARLHDAQAMMSLLDLSESRLLPALAYNPRDPNLNRSLLVIDATRLWLQHFIERRVTRVPQIIDELERFVEKHQPTDEGPAGERVRRDP